MQCTVNIHTEQVHVWIIIPFGHKARKCMHAHVLQVKIESVIECVISSGIV